MKTFLFGLSRLGLPIVAHHFGTQGPRVLILGGVHGDEVEGIIATNLLLNRFAKSFSFKVDLTLIPVFNVDGLLFHQRGNGSGVDLNRNLPTSDWSSEIKEERYRPGDSAASEPETQALVAFIEKQKPNFVLSFHSWIPLLNVNGRCDAEAEVISRYTGYPVAPTVGYPTPGCLGTYCGLEREIPTLTYELEKKLSADQILAVHQPAVLEALKVIERRG